MIEKGGHNLLKMTPVNKCSPNSIKNVPPVNYPLMIRELLVRGIVTQTQTPKRLCKRGISKLKNQLIKQSFVETRFVAIDHYIRLL